METEEKYLIEVLGEEKELLTCYGFSNAINVFLDKIRHFVHHHEQVISEWGLFRVLVCFDSKFADFSITDEEIVFERRMSLLLTNFYWDIGDQTEKNLAWIKKSYVLPPFDYFDEPYSFSINRSETGEITMNLKYEDGHFVSNAFSFNDPNRTYYFNLDDFVVIGGEKGVDELSLGTEIQFSISLKKA